jgi:Recombinase
MQVVHEAVRSGAVSFADIAEKLNAQGIAAPSGRRWNARSVAKALERAQEARREPERDGRSLTEFAKWVGRGCRTFSSR